MILRRPGAAAAPATLTLVDLTLQDADPAGAYCSIKFKTDGSVVVTADGGSAPPWLQQGVAANYTIRLDTESGTLSVGTAGQDLAMTSDREFGVSRTTVGSKAWVGTVTVKRVSDGAVVAGPADLSLSALVVGANTGGGGGDGVGDGGGGINIQ